MLNARFVLQLIFGLWFCHSLLAQQGPDVPCAQCEGYAGRSYPETGWWYNPDQDGSGFSIEVQNGILVGAYYGYDDAGEPIWYLLNGRLQESEEAFYSLTTELLVFRGGNCLGCDYEPPTIAEDSRTIKIDFLQRNHARFSVDGNEAQFIVPLIYGTPAPFRFTDLIRYQFPELEGRWTFTFHDPDGPSWWAEVYNFLPAGSQTDDDLEFDVSHSIFRNSGRIFVTPVGEFACTAEPIATGDRAAPVCKADLNLQPPQFVSGVGRVMFDVPLANFSDSRIEGISQDGLRFTATRIDYD